MTISRGVRRYCLSWTQKWQNGDHQEPLDFLQIQTYAQSHPLIHHDLLTRSSHLYYLSAKLHCPCITNQLLRPRNATGPFLHCIILRAALTLDEV